jgi:two-component system nitrogen regulation response regulator GlnG
VLVLTVLSHPDPRRVGERAALPELGLGRRVEVSRGTPRFAPPGSPWDDRSLDDSYLSRKAWSIVPTNDGLVLERGASSIVLHLEGALVGERASVDEGALEGGITLEFSGRVALLLHRLPQQAFETGESKPPSGTMVGASAALIRVRGAIARVADLAVPVLLRGESGTGKELAARALHEQSRRAEGPFVAVDLGALTPALAASELFGHAKGAFTGAVAAREGFFRAAEGGTLFLDEVGEATMEVQAMLLRVLETRRVVPVGSQTPRPVEVRLVAATDSDLEARTRRGDFKEPLLHRLAAYVIELPPLRERRDDIGRLLVHLARPVLRELGEEERLDHPAGEGLPWLPAELVGRLVRSPWSGNIRQLANVVRQLVIDCRGDSQLRLGPRIESMLDAQSPRGASVSLPSISPSAAQVEVQTARQEEGVEKGENRQTPYHQTLRRPSDLDDVEVEEAMRANDFEPAAAARHLGIRRPSLYNLIRRHPRLRLAEEIPEEELRSMLGDCAGDVAAAARRLEVSWRALGRRVARLNFG